jgi:hypothetical protein
MRTLGRCYAYPPRSEADTYHYAILARQFVKAGRVGLALVVRTTSLVGTVENVEVVVINVVASKDIGDKFED